MVFKTICVGSIPATLAIVKLKKKKISFKNNFKKIKIKKKKISLLSRLKIKKIKFFKKSFFKKSKKSFLAKLIKPVKALTKKTLTRSLFVMTNKSLTYPTLVSFYKTFLFYQYNYYLQQTPIRLNTFNIFFFVNSTYYTLNHYQSFKNFIFPKNISSFSIKSKHFSLRTKSKVKFLYTNFINTMNKISIRYLGYLFRIIKKHFLIETIFLDFFFLENYNIKKTQLARLGRFSSYYFLKDFKIKQTKFPFLKNLNPYGFFLSNDNLLEKTNLKFNKATNFRNSFFNKVKTPFFWKKKTKILKKKLSTVFYLLKKKKKLKSLFNSKFIKKRQYKKLIKKIVKSTILQNIFSKKWKVNRQFNNLNKPIHYLSFVNNNLNPLPFSNKSINLNLLNNLKKNVFIFKTSLKIETFLKYLYLTLSSKPMFSFKTLPILLNNFFFSNRLTYLKKTNLIPLTYFNFCLQKKILKIVNFAKFRPNVVMWYYVTLVRFLESLTGKKIYLKVNPFLINELTFSDKARCVLWKSRLSAYKKILGPRIFVRDSLQVFHLAFRLQDMSFLSNWIRIMLSRIDFFKYKILFRYIKYLIRYLFFPYFSEWNLKGIKYKIKGKVGVAGNSRTRKVFYKLGKTSHATFNHKINYDFSLINTFTGVLGFQLWLFF